MEIKAVVNTAAAEMSFTSFIAGSFLWLTLSARNSIDVLNISALKTILIINIKTSHSVVLNLKKNAARITIIAIANITWKVL